MDQCGSPQALAPECPFCGDELDVLRTDGSVITANCNRCRETLMVDAPPAPVAPRPRYRCCNCKAPAMLCELNADMLCDQCGVPDEDPDGVIDTSAAEMRREHGFYV